MSAEPLLISAVISIVVSIIITATHDRCYRFFNSGRAKYETEEYAPKIFTGKRIELVENQDTSKIFTATIICDVDEENQNVKETYSLDFTSVPSLSKADERFDYGFRLQNHSNDGISLNTYQGMHGEDIDLSNWSSRHIDPGCSVILLYSLRDRPCKILATFQQRTIRYVFNLNSNYIKPNCITPLEKYKKKNSVK